MRCYDGTRALLSASPAALLVARITAGRRRAALSVLVGRAAVRHRRAVAAVPTTVGIIAVVRVVEVDWIRLPREFHCSSGRPEVVLAVVIALPGPVDWGPLVGLEGDWCVWNPVPISREDEPGPGAVDLCTPGQIIGGQRWALSGRRSKSGLNQRDGKLLTIRKISSVVEVMFSMRTGHP